MDLRQIEYIVKIAEEQNITRAASKLYISQPALNQQLLNLEKELGAQLFHRDRNNWSMTEAGEIYLETGKQILALKKDAYDRISDVANIKEAELVIGVTPGRGGSMMAWVYKKFHHLYPKVNLKIHQSNGRKIKKDIDAGILDVGIMTIGEDWNIKEEYEELKREEMVVVMSKEHPLAQKAFRGEDRALVMDIKEFENEPFALGDRSGMNHMILSRLFEDAGFAPKLYFEGGSFELRMSMVEENICCSMIEEHHKIQLSEKLVTFQLSAHPVLLVVSIHKKGKYLSKAAKDFIHLAREYWNQYEL